MQYKIVITACGCDPTFKRREYRVEAPDMDAAKRMAQEAKNNLRMKGHNIRKVRVTEA